jgi:predicted RNA-binding Zn ribbon-like protein
MATPSTSSVSAPTTAFITPRVSPTIPASGTIAMPATLRTAVLNGRPVARAWASVIPTRASGGPAVHPVGLLDQHDASACRGERPDERLAALAEADDREIHRDHTHGDHAGRGAPRTSERGTRTCGKPAARYRRDVNAEASAADGDVPAGEPRFNFRSGRLCLALVATVGERWRGRHERLREPADLARWYVEAGLLQEAPRVTASGLEAARELREAVHRIARALIAGERPSAGDEAVLNAAAAAPPLVPVLRAGTGHLALPATRGQQAALSTVARDAVDLFAGPAAARLRACASPECALLFVDTSRPGRRRWCSSTACGGRDRAAAYRRRRAAADG